MRVLITTVLLVPLAACASPTAFDRGLANLRAGRYAEAKAAFDEALQASAAALANRGVARARLGDLDGAIDDYTRALDLAPGDGDILFDRGNAWAAKGEYHRAMADFRRAAEADPRRAQALFRNAAIELQREPNVTAAPRPREAVRAGGRRPGAGEPRADPRAPGGPRRRARGPARGDREGDGSRAPDRPPQSAAPAREPTRSTRSGRSWRFDSMRRSGPRSAPPSRGCAAWLATSPGSLPRTSTSRSGSWAGSARRGRRSSSWRSPGRRRGSPRSRRTSPGSAHTHRRRARA